jgi:hypothetical protein
MSRLNTVVQVIPPALPQSPAEYAPQYQNQFNNVLRLYFTTLNNALNSVIDTDNGAAALYAPHGSFYSVVDQTAATIDTATKVSFGETSFSEGVTIASGTALTIKYKGVWSFSLTLQLRGTATAGRAVVWLKQNGTSVPYSSQAYSAVAEGNKQLVYNHYLSCEVGDVIEVEWATDNVDLILEATSPNAPYPGVPSANIVVGFVSNEKV